ANLALCDRARELVDADGKNWDKFTRQAREFHLRNAAAWGNSRSGVDLGDQIDPDFVLGPQAIGSRETTRVA
ncbi:MAG: ATP-binding protein, partial [Stackebrandtia sp.]